MPGDNQLKDIINWDVETWKEILPYLETQLLNYDKTTATCIEIGSREGGISLWMALHGFKITCSDIYYDLEDAKKLHLKYGVSDKITYQKTDILDWHEKNKYDIIIVKSVLGSLQNETAIEMAIKNIYENLKAGGILLFAENSKSTLAHRQFRKRFTDWGSIWYYFDEKTLLKMFEKFSKLEIKYNGVLTVFGNRLGMPKFFSKLDKYIFNKITPHRVKYMLFGSAKK